MLHRAVGCGTPTSNEASSRLGSELRAEALPPASRLFPPRPALSAIPAFSAGRLLFPFLSGKGKTISLFLCRRKTPAPRPAILSALSPVLFRQVWTKNYPEICLFYNLL